jgi:transposase
MPPRRRYPSDLRAAEWALLAPHIPAIKPGGRPARWSRQELVNAVLYVLRNGCTWRALPWGVATIGSGGLRESEVWDRRG